MRSKAGRERREASEEEEKEETEGFLRKVEEEEGGGEGDLGGGGDSLGRCWPQFMSRADQARYPSAGWAQLGLLQRKKLQREEGSVEGPRGLEHM